MVLAVVVGRAVVVVGRAVTRFLDAITMQCKNCCHLFKAVECLLRPSNRFQNPIVTTLAHVVKRASHTCTAPIVAFSLLFCSYQMNVSPGNLEFLPRDTPLVARRNRCEV